MAAKVLVSLQYSLDNSVIPISLPVTATIGELKDAWSQATSLSHDEHRFCEIGGAVLPEDDTPVSQRLQPGLFVYVVLVEPFGQLSVAFRGLPSVHTVAKFSADTTCEEVLAAVRQRLCLGNRPMRLMFKDKPLDPTNSLSEQEVTSGDEVVVDLEFCVHVTTVAATDFEASESDDDDDDDASLAEPEVAVYGPRSVACFASSPLMCLLTPNFAVERQRVVVGSRVASGAGSIAGLLGDDALHTARWDVTIEHSLTVVVERHRDESVTISHVEVWPSHAVGVVVHSGAERVFWEGVQVDADLTFLELDVRDYSLLVVEKALSQPVRDSRGLPHVVHLRSHATVGELRLALLSLEPGGAFEMWANGVTLDEWARSLSSYGVDTSTEVEMHSVEEDVLETGGQEAVSATAASPAWPNDSDETESITAQSLMENRQQCETLIETQRLDLSVWRTTPHTHPEAPVEQALELETAMECERLRRQLKEKEQCFAQERERLEASVKQLRSDLKKENDNLRNARTEIDALRNQVKENDERSRQEQQRLEAELKQLRDDLDRTNDDLNKARSESHFHRLQNTRKEQSFAQERQRLETRVLLLDTSLKESQRVIRGLSNRTSCCRSVQAGGADAGMVPWTPFIFGGKKSLTSRNVQAGGASAGIFPSSFNLAAMKSPTQQVSIRIEDLINGRWILRFFNVPSPATNGDIRAAVAEEVGVDTNEVKMERDEGRAPWGATVVQIDDFFYGDITGKKCGIARVQDKISRVLEDDGEEFWVPGKQLSRLRVSIVE